jgi:hypothetical protein
LRASFIAGTFDAQPHGSRLSLEVP